MQLANAAKPVPKPAHPPLDRNHPSLAAAHDIHALTIFIKFGITASVKIFYPAGVFT